MVLWREDRPLDRISAETRRSNAALQEYALMGAGRSLPKLCARFRAVPKDDSPQPPTRRLSTLKRWSTERDWVARVERWDDLRWETRRRAVLEEDWQDGETLREKARALLENIAGSTLSQIVEAVQVASKLQRLATDRPTDQISLSLTGQALDGVIEREVARLVGEVFGEGETDLGAGWTLEEILARVGGDDNGSGDLPGVPPG